MDHLFLEVWDFDPAETVGEKFGKIFQVKGVRGAKKLLKEIAVTATAGQHKNELIGTAKIPLKVSKKFRQIENLPIHTFWFNRPFLLLG